MVPASQAPSSTNWKFDVWVSKNTGSHSETTKVASVVHSAIQRMLRREPSSSPRISMMQATPRIGRKVMTERTGQSVMVSFRPSGREDEPGEDRREADQHREGVVVEVARLQADRAARHVEHPGRDAVGAEPVDDGSVAPLPQEAAERLGPAHEQEVVDLVEVPLVEKEAVEEIVLPREPDRRLLVV